MIVYGFVKDGGFVAADTESELTSYAYPSSWFSRHAKKKPGPTAAAMLASERQRRFRAAYDKRNWAALNAVRFPVVDGVVHLPADAIIPETSS